MEEWSLATFLASLARISAAESKAAAGDCARVRGDRGRPDAGRNGWRPMATTSQAAERARNKNTVSAAAAVNQPDWPLASGAGKT